MIWHKYGDKQNRTVWKSLKSIKNWATRNHHAWVQFDSNVVIVSTANGERHVYLDDNIIPHTHPKPKYSTD